MNEVDMKLDRLKLELLQLIRVELTESVREIRALRDSVLQLETHGFPKQIEHMREELQEMREKVAILETHNKVFSVAVSTGVSIMVAIVLHFLKSG